MGREREDGHVYFTGGLVVFPGKDTRRLKWQKCLLSMAKYLH